MLPPALPYCGWAGTSSGAWPWVSMWRRLHPAAAPKSTGKTWLRLKPWGMPVTTLRFRETVVLTNFWASSIWGRLPLSMDTHDKLCHNLIGVRFSALKAPRYVTVMVGVVSRKRRLTLGKSAKTLLRGCSMMYPIRSG